LVTAAAIRDIDVYRYRNIEFGAHFVFEAVDRAAANGAGARQRSGARSARAITHGCRERLSAIVVEIVVMVRVIEMSRYSGRQGATSNQRRRAARDHIAHQQPCKQL
jgi:hypothetical protein